MAPSAFDCEAPSGTVDVTSIEGDFCCALVQETGQTVAPAATTQKKNGVFIFIDSLPIAYPITGQPSLGIQPVGGYGIGSYMLEWIRQRMAILYAI
jgi:hypothetical protein